VYIFQFCLLAKLLNTFSMHIKLKKKLKITHARKYTDIKFKLRCDYNVNMN